MTLTRARTIQYIGILFSLMLIAVGYWYFQVRAGVKSNTATSQPQGVGRLDSGLAGYWKLDETTGSTATDSSTNGNNGTAQNMENGDWVAGQIGNGLDFDGTNEYISVPDASSLDITNTLTIGAWIKLDTLPAAGAFTSIVSKGNSGAAEANYELGTYSSGGFHRVSFFFYNGASHVIRGNSSSLTLGVWHHVVATYDDTANDIKLYVDGVQESGETVEFGTPETSSIVANNQLVNIGAYSGNQKWMDGKIDEARIYNRALSSDEAGQLYRLTTPTAVDTSLKGYWSFDGQDISGTTAYDRSGAGNNGSMYNSPTKTEGIAGQALLFDGVNDIVEPLSNAPNITGALTASFWMKTTSTSSQKTILGFWSTTGWMVHFDGDGSGPGKVSFYSNNSGYKYSSTTVNDGLWHHIAFTLTSGGALTIYRDGVVDGSFTSVPLPGSYIAEKYIGASPAGGQYFPGTLDEIRIYNQALSASQIKSLYDLAKPDATNSSSSQAQGSGRLDSGLAGYWKLDDGSGTSATDSSTNGNTGTLSGPTWTTGQIGSAVHFDGVDDYVTAAGSTSSVNITGPLTVSAWIKPGTNSSTQDIISKWDGGSNVQYILLINSTGTLVTLCVGDGSGPECAAASVTVGTWSHVVGMWDGTDTKIFLNGAFVAKAVAPIAPRASGTSLLFGHTNGYGDRWYNGDLDEVRVYNRALSSDEVAQLYRLTTPTAVDTSLKGYWSFNGKDMSGTTAYDRSGAGNNGTLTNSPTKTEGILGQALSFNGSNQYVSVPYTSALNPTSAVTVSAWIKTTATGRREIIQRRLNFNNFDGYDLLIGDDYDNCGGTGSTGRLGFWLGTSSNVLCSKRTVNDGNWHFVSGTYDGTTSRIYIDGVLAGSATVVNQLNNTTSDLYIGASPVGSALFNGSIDEPRVYSRALSESEIKAMYDAGQSDKANSSVTQPQGTGRLDSGLAGYWKLDATSGSTAVDSSTGGNNGTLSNMEDGDWTTGQIGNSLDFDGTNERVTVSAGTGVLNASQNVTLSTWVYPRSPGIYQGLIYKGVGGCDEGTASYMLELNASGSPAFWVGGSQLVANDVFLTANQWQHLVATNSAGGSAIYINGVLIKSGTALSTPSSSSNDWYFNFCNPFNGKMDEVRIYNRALSADEVSQLYRLNSPTGTDTSLKGYWSFNGKDISGTTAYDRSGSGNTGTLAGATVTEGKLGQGLSFDGNDYVASVANSTALASLTQGSFAFWIYPRAASCQGGIFRSIANDNGGNGPFVQGFEVSGDLWGCTQAIRFAADGSTGDMQTRSAATLSLNRWTHVVVVWDGTLTAANTKFYFDGVLVGTSTGMVDGSGSYVPSDGNFAFGVEVGSGYFNGALDEFRVYNRQLTAAEVLGLYNLSR